MSDAISAFPLQWPAGRSRRAHYERKTPRFTHQSHNDRYAKPITVAKARERLQDELDRIGAQGEVLSTNIALRLDGLPRSGQRDPEDPGVCLYFRLDGEPVAMPCDTYDTVAGNIAALAAHIEATRKIERHGVASVREMFTGFTALPAPIAMGAENWWTVLNVERDASPEDVRRAFKAKAKEAHPDNGGSTEAMVRVNAAWAAAREGARA